MLDTPLINPIDQDALREEFQNAQPFPFFRIDNFLNEQFAEEVYLSFPSYGDARAVGKEFRGVNEQGKVVGINTRGVARGRAVTIPSATVNRVVDELLEKGHISRPYLGLAMQPVAIPESMRSKFKSESGGGLVVVHVEPSGPADQAGILLGDVLVELQGKSLESLESIQQILSSAKVGDKIPATILRGGSPKELAVTLLDRPTR